MTISSTQILKEPSTSFNFISTPARQAVEFTTTHMENCIEFRIAQMTLETVYLIRNIANKKYLLKENNFTSKLFLSASAGRR